MNGRNGGYKPPMLKMNRRAFIFLAVIVGIGGLLTYFSIFFPAVFTAIINFFWIMMLIIVAVFLVLGILVIVGLKEEVSSFLDVLLEGSLTIIDAIDFIKQLYDRFIELLRDFIYFITPLLAALVALAIYLGILVLYKGVGRENDITILTAVITVAMVVAVAVLNRPVEEQPITTWAQAVRKRFKDYFSDSFEVVIFIFFLTMDLTNLFFLPPELNVPLRAEVGDTDLMLRAVNVTNQLTTTVYLVTLGIILEIIRNIIRLIAVAVNYYNSLSKQATSKMENIKESIRLSFGDSKDDLMKFITFTTVLILVFLVFPRLKLFAMVVASLTGLVMDAVIPGRLKMREGNDLISRILNRTFKL